MQQITITGYLSRDAEKRDTQSGRSVTNLNVPVKQGFGDREQTNWFKVAIWGKRADFAANFRKGDFVCVTGELTIGEYNGKPQYEISASDFHSIKGNRTDPAPQSDSGGWGGYGATDDLNDEVPF